jgi:hypothetical protein
MSVSISRQFRRNARLMQEVAILELRLREFEKQSARSRSAAAEANGKPDDLAASH